MIDFREKWITEGALNFNLDLMQCTAYGGLCEHPRQLDYCASKGNLNSFSFWITSICLLVTIIQNLAPIFKYVHM